jgi:asparagine synthase (glutamine-hydrolysing)
MLIEQPLEWIENQAPIFRLDCTDYMHDEQGWMVIVDSMRPCNRHNELQRDATSLIRALEQGSVDTADFERLFGGHFVALALNKHTGDIWIARDVSGAKSVYFAQLPSGELVIGTNMHDVAALDASSTLSRTAALHLMTVDYLFDGETFYNNVHEFTIGTLHVCEPGQMPRLVQDYPLNLAEIENVNDINVNIRRLREEILAAHERRYGDENIVLLSGGIDSSVMLCALREVAGRERVRAITFRVKNTIEDETVYAISLAKHLGVEIERIEVDPCAEDIAINFDAEISKMNSPYFGRYIFGQFKGTANQVFFAGQDTRLHTPDLNQIDMLAFQLLRPLQNSFFRSVVSPLGLMANPLISQGWSNSVVRWKRGVVRSLLAVNLNEYISRFFFKLNPENLLKDGYSSDMILEAKERLAVDWQAVKSQRQLYNKIVANKWGEQYTDDMRYLQDVARINKTHIALPFYDINLARFSSSLPFKQSSKFMKGQSKFDTGQMTKVNKYLLREAFKKDMNKELYLRAKAVSRSQHLMFSGTLGKRVRSVLAVDTSRSKDSLVGQMGLGALAERFLATERYVPEDEVFLTKVYWLSVLSTLGEQRRMC